MISLSQKIKSLELEIDKDKDFLELHQAFLRDHIKQKSFLAVAAPVAALTGFAYGYLIMDKPSVASHKQKIKKHISLVKTFYKNFNLVMPLLSMLKVI
jgi:hypothetical protein